MAKSEGIQKFAFTSMQVKIEKENQEAAELRRLREQMKNK